VTSFLGLENESSAKLFCSFGGEKKENQLLMGRLFFFIQEGYYLQTVPWKYSLIVVYHAFGVSN